MKLLNSVLNRYEKRETLLAFCFLLPLVVLVSAFIFLPVLGTFLNSLYSDISINKVLSPGDGAIRIAQYVEVEAQATPGDSNPAYARYFLPPDSTLLVRSEQEIEVGTHLGGGEISELKGIAKVGTYLDYQGQNGFNKKLRLKLGQDILFIEDGSEVKSGQVLASQSWFVGFSNYAQLFEQAKFWTALRFTLLFALASVLLEVLLGTCFALLLHEPFRGRGLLRAIVLVPWAIPTIISAKTWGFMYNYEYGLFNWIGVNLFGVDKIDWVGSASSAFWAIVFTDVWKTTPFIVIILLAGLQAIPQELYKQAKIDGCGMFKSFFKITLPLVFPVLIVALIFRTVDALRIFDLVYVLTGGGPSDSTQTLSTVGYEYLVNKSDFGMGSTISFVTFLVGFGIALCYIKVGKFGKTIQ